MKDARKDERPKVARYFVVLGEKHGDDESNHGDDNSGYIKQDVITTTLMAL